MAKHYSSEDAMRNIKMPVVKDVRVPDSAYMGKHNGDGSMGYLARMDGRSASDASKLRKSMGKK